MAKKKKSQNPLHMFSFYGIISDNIRKRVFTFNVISMHNIWWNTSVFVLLEKKKKKDRFSRYFCVLQLFPGLWILLGNGPFSRQRLLIILYMSVRLDWFISFWKYLFTHRSLCFSTPEWKVLMEVHSSSSCLSSWKAF